MLASEPRTFLAFPQHTLFHTKQDSLKKKTHAYPLSQQTAPLHRYDAKPVSTPHPPPCSAQSPPYRATSRPAPASSAHLPPTHPPSSAVLHRPACPRKNKSCSRSCKSNPLEHSANPKNPLPQPPHPTRACRSTNSRTPPPLQALRRASLSGSRTARRSRRARSFIRI